ncbi:MAG: Clp1/GlmU family protein [Acidobacteriota bacterium]
MVDEIIPEVGWIEFLKEIERKNSKIFIIGGVDSGKTTFARFAINWLIEKKNKVYFIDCDVGQSTIGPPTTISSVLFIDPPNWSEDIKPDYLYFVGRASPESNVYEVIFSFKKIYEISNSIQFDYLIVDTTGMVTGDDAFYLKKIKVEITSPDYIVFFLKENELDHLIKYFSDKKINTICFPISKDVKPRTKERRKSYRENRFRNYFKNSFHKKITLPEKILTKFASEIQDKTLIKGLLVGLNNEKYITAGLGLIDDIDFGNGTLSILTPLNNLSSVKFIKFGFLKLNEDFSESGQINVNLK